MQWRGWSLFLTFQTPRLRPFWLPQFFLLLCIATGLLPVAMRFQRNVHRVLVLLSVTLVAWGTRIEGAEAVSAALVAAYFIFLTWLAGLVGNRGHQIRRQNEEILRIDATVRALSEANLDFQDLATRVQRETEEQERKRLAREIHDIVGHTLMNIQMMMEAATDLARNRREGLEDLLVSPATRHSAACWKPAVPCGTCAQSRKSTRAGCGGSPS